MYNRTDVVRNPDKRCLLNRFKDSYGVPVDLEQRSKVQISLCYWISSDYCTSYLKCSCRHMFRLASSRLSSLHHTLTAPATTSIRATQRVLFYHATTMTEQRRAGVAAPEELKVFVEKAGSNLIVVDVRNPDADVEPGDQKTLAFAGLPSESSRPQAQNLIYDRQSKTMPLPNTADKSTPIITHCGGGGRGEKAKIFLKENGFTNVLNGGGPSDTDCWNEFGDK